MQKTKTKDARQNYRHKARDHYLIIDRRSGEVIGQLFDISQAGFRIITHSSLLPNTPLECQLSLPRPIANVREIPLEATVRWCLRNAEKECFEVGCQLHEVTATTRTILLEILAEFEGR